MKNKTSILLLFLTFLFVNVGNATAQQYVDLGLPSGTLWATCNIGASNPWNYGDYFAWGETYSKYAYKWSSYKYANGMSSRLNKYCNNSLYGYNRYTDSRTKLDRSDDVAYQKWGSNWCMPTQAQFQELFENCTNEWTSNYQGKGVAGILFRSRKNGNTIFFPAAGKYDYDEKPLRVGSMGYYWSVSLYKDLPNYAKSFDFNSTRVYTDNNNRNSRNCGLSVRAVRCSNSATSQTRSNGHQYIDLGLPYGTLWATTNIGASNPEDYGDYFAWGETTTKSTYLWSTYKHGNGSDSDVSKKYNKSDGRTKLERIDDVAYKNWGSDWCMPTQVQFQELKDKCTWTRTTLNGKKGYNVKGPNGKSIFLPAAGYKGCYEKTTSFRGSNGYYWSSSLYTDDPGAAYQLRFFSSYISPFNNRFVRYCGLSVRPVRCRN